jgi:hypothetical protein
LSGRLEFPENGVQPGWVGRSCETLGKDSPDVRRPLGSTCIGAFRHSAPLRNIRNHLILLNKSAPSSGEKGRMADFEK